MDNSINIKINNKDYRVVSNTMIKDILRDENITMDNPILLCKVNNKVKELNYKVKDGEVLETIDLTYKDGNKVLVNGLIFVLLVAIKELYGKEKDIEVEHSLDKGLFIETTFDIGSEDIDKIRDKMKEIISEDRPITKVVVDRFDAISYFKNVNETSKADSLKYYTNNYISLYKLGDYYDYFFTKMPISTGVLDSFDLNYVENNGFMLRFPTIYINNRIPEYKHHDKMYKTFNDCKEWTVLMNCANASGLNNIVSSGNIDEIIRICEHKLNEEFLEIARLIVKDSDKKVVLMAGPSSSGKTTSSKKLCMALKSLGKHPTVLAMDDYFVERDETPVDENGKKDYECLEAVDLELFENNIRDLLDGKEVKIPTYNFLTGSKEYKKTLKMNEDDIILIEGIHALDDKVLTHIDLKNKYRIYISAITEINIDSHNYISTTDNRLLRRIVRDSKTRGYSATDTINSWPSVRKGEEKYIFPFQDSCDYVINTSMLYELGVLKTYVEPLLFSVDSDCEYYAEARRLINFLKNFLPIPADAIPDDSIIREFIGGTCFNE